VTVGSPGAVASDRSAGSVARIRPYLAADLDALYRVCLLTGRGGQDATGFFTDPALPGHLYAAPYGLFEPGLAFVAEDEAGVGGYVVGALDSPAFERRLDLRWWPRLRGRYPDPWPGLPEAEWTADQRMAHQIHHPWRTPVALAERYPAHLHINLVPRLQGRGHGGQLIRALLAALRGRGSPGVHLHVHPDNRRAIGFYRHVGFAPFADPAGPALCLDLRAAAGPEGASGGI
jgi:ribosomal protein S18 acetylase RimI-like enzyme